MPAEILVICFALLALNLTSPKQRQRLASNPFGRALVGWSIIAVFALIFVLGWHWAARGHPIANLVPYLMTAFPIVANLQWLICLLLWPISGSSSSEPPTPPPAAHPTAPPREDPKATNLHPSLNPSVAIHSSTLMEANASVVILVPTVNEPVDLLHATLSACQALQWNNFQVLVLDDGQRPAVKDLALQLGCQYWSRSERIHAKAGNLNYGLQVSSSMLVAVFDADFVPQANFLKKTVPYFADPKIGIVQTPQFMRRPEPISVFLGSSTCSSESDPFYLIAQPAYQLLGSVICCGTSCVFRRAALEAVQGFFLESSTEDYYTGITINAAGFATAYHCERLSDGLPPASMDTYLLQRQRWARGTMQGLRTRANPFRIAGLSLTQRGGHLLSLASWLREPLTLLQIAIGTGLALRGAFWLPLNWEEFLGIYFPLYLLSHFQQNSALPESLPRNFPYLRNVVANFPILRAMIWGILAPRQVSFRVTTKQRAAESISGAAMESLVFAGAMIAVLSLGLANSVRLLLTYQSYSWTTLVTSREFFMPSAAAVWAAFWIIQYSLGIVSIFRK